MAELPLTPGDVLPDLELADHTGVVRPLSDVIAGDPTFLHGFRGPWCPKEQTFFRRLVGLQDELEVAYVRLVSLSVDPPAVSAAFRAGLGARWTFLCDPGRVELERLGLRETTDTVHDPYVPFAVTLHPDRTIRRVWNGYWSVGRPTDEEIRLDLREIQRAVRADWDAPTP